MAKPTKHRGKWRIRWTDHIGKRQSEVYERYKDAEIALHRHKLEAAEVRRGHRSPVTAGKTFSELWYAHSAPHAFAADYDRLPEIKCRFVSGARDEKGVWLKERSPYVR